MCTYSNDGKITVLDIYSVSLSMDNLDLKPQIEPQAFVFIVVLIQTDIIQLDHLANSSGLSFYNIELLLKSVSTLKEIRFVTFEDIQKTNKQQKKWGGGGGFKLCM